MGLSLRQARLCLDCDCLTNELSCPWCDRDGTVPIAGWFRPLDDSQGNASRHDTTAAPTAPQWILIVQPHQRELYRILREALAGTGVEVLYERRRGQRRRTAAGPAAGEQRRRDRRRPRPTAVVYQGAVTPKPPESPLDLGAGRAAAGRGARTRRRPADLRPAGVGPGGAQVVPQTSLATESTSSIFRR